jgi:hypothetical protein
MMRKIGLALVTALALLPGSCPDAQILHGAFVASSVGPSFYWGAVAGKTLTNEVLSPEDTQLMTRTPHYARDNMELKLPRFDGRVGA